MVKQIFEISDDAAKQINVAAEESESSKWPLRISLNVDSSGKFNYLMGFDQSKEEDLQLKVNGISPINISARPVYIEFFTRRFFKKDWKKLKFSFIKIYSNGNCQN